MFLVLTFGVLYLIFHVSNARDISVKRFASGLMMYLDEGGGGCVCVYFSFLCLKFYANQFIILFDFHQISKFFCLSQNSNVSFLTFPDSPVLVPYTVFLSKNECIKRLELFNSIQWFLMDVDFFTALISCKNNKCFVHILIIIFL